MPSLLPFDCQVTTIPLHCKPMHGTCPAAPGVNGGPSPGPSLRPHGQCSSPRATPASGGLCHICMEPHHNPSHPAKSPSRGPGRENIRDQCPTPPLEGGRAACPRDGRVYRRGLLTAGPKPGNNEWNEGPRGQAVVSRYCNSRPQSPQHRVTRATDSGSGSLCHLKRPPSNSGWHSQYSQNFAFLNVKIASSEEADH